MTTISGKWNEAPGAVTLIDAHHHLWDLKANRYPSLSGPPDPHFFMGSNEAIRRDYLPEDYLRDSSAHNVLTTVHCEAEMDRTKQVAETQWLTEVNARYGFPGAIVAHAWFHTDNAEEIIAAQSQFPLVRGIRSKPVTAARPGASPSGVTGTMQDDRWLRGFALLENPPAQTAPCPIGGCQFQMGDGDGQPAIGTGRRLMGKEPVHREGGLRPSLPASILSTRRRGSTRIRNTWKGLGARV